jgi:hypothetical protein
MKKYTVQFKVISESNVGVEDVEYYLKDLINKSVLPALNLELVPLTFEVKVSRN